jgi:hypothetical protein
MIRCFALLAVACGDAKGPGDGGTAPVDTGVSAEADTSSVPGDPSDSGDPADTEDADTGDTAAGDDTCDSCPVSTATVALELASEHLTLDTWRTRENPLKGFMTSYAWGEPATDFPDQMEFMYLSMADLWNASGDTLETGLEPRLVAAAARGHHAVLRVYIDYPNSESGLPDYLTESVSCTPYEDYGSGCSPDYDQPELVEAMLGLIAAMGARYDGDPRLGAVQVGLLGFWGEWHTYPYTDWFPSDETQAAVLSGYDTAFETTQLQVRRAAANSVDLRIGFHDDSFAYSTVGEVDWFFVPGLEAAGAEDRWQEVAIGGELRPELQASVFSDDYLPGLYAQDMVECIDATHASYLLNYYAFNGDGTGYTGDDRTRAEESALHLGYQFEIHSAQVVATGLSEGTVEASLTIELGQTGVAPFYYPVFLAAQSDALPEAVVSTEDLNTLLPGTRRTVTVDLGRISVDVLNGPISLDLVSTILQEGQQIALATRTPWSADTGPTRLQWEIRCVTDGLDLELGEIASTTEAGCDCTCDVDGLLRTCGGEPCSDG